MKKKSLSILGVLIAFFSLAPSTSYAALTTFSPGECPTETDLYTHMGNEVDARIVGLTGATSEKNVFTSQNFTTHVYVRNPDLWTSKGDTPLDFSGVSPWNAGFGSYSSSANLITPRHIIHAAHASIPTPVAVDFVRPDNTVVSRTITSAQAIPGTDIRIGVLNADVPADITHYPIISETEFRKYLDSFVRVPIVVFDQNERASIKEINSAYDQIVHFSAPAGTTRALFNAVLGNGDSGNPAFTVIAGKPVLMFTHQSASAAPHAGRYIAQINAALASLGGGYEVSEFDLTCFNKRPTLSTPDTVVVAENTGIGASFGVLDADDEDGDDLVFTIVSGDSEGMFAINAEGEISVTKPLDYETQSTYTLGVRVSDGVLATAVVSVPISVTDVPEPTIEAAQFSVKENTSTGTLVGTVVFDSSDTNPSVVAIVSGNTDSAFSIEPTGEIRVAGALDYESIKSYTLTVSISDVYGSSSAEIDIAIENVSEGSIGGGGGGRSVPVVTTAPVAVIVSEPVTTSVPSLVSDSFIFSLNRGVGEVGEDIKRLQQFLNTHGYVVALSGPGSKGFETTRFGPATKAAVQQYQRAQGIVPVSGYLGPITRAHIAKFLERQTNTLPPSTSSTSFGARGAEVVALQKALIAQGFAIPSGPTGYFGGQTYAAFVAFQQKNNITPISEVLTDPLKALLNI